MRSFVPAQPEDAPILARLRQRVWAETYGDIYPAEMIENFDYEYHTRQDFVRIQSPGYMVYLIQQADKPIGYLILKAGEPLWLLSLYVLAEYQRRGIGKAAFQLIRKYCASQGIGEFSCQCQPQNTPAIAFYKAMGGRITARDEGNEETWQDSVTFTFRVRQYVMTSHL